MITWPDLRIPPINLWNAPRVQLPSTVPTHRAQPTNGHRGQFRPVTAEIQQLLKAR